MKLSDILKMKEGDSFYYNGNPATIVWIEKIEDVVHIEKDGTNIIARCFGVYFVYTDQETNRKDITLRSWRQDPTTLDLKEYTI